MHELRMTHKNNEIDFNADDLELEGDSNNTLAGDATSSKNVSVDENATSMDDQTHANYSNICMYEAYARQS